jgi:MFS family permease
VFGWLADRVSRWLLVGVGVGVWSLASGASGLAHTFTILLITRLFVGIGEAGYGPAAPTIIADLYPIEQRGQKLAWFYMAIPVGSALGYMWGGALAAAINWRWAFYTVVPPGLVLAALSLIKRDPRRTARTVQPTTHNPQPPTAVESNAPPRAAGYLSLLRNRSYLLDCAGMTAMTFAIGGISFWMPHYLVEYRNAGTLAHVNTIFGGLTVVAGIAATLLGGIAGDRLRPRYPGSYFLVSGIAILIACPFVLLMMYLESPWLWVALFVAVFFLFFNTGPTNTILANVTAPSIRASGFALNILLIHALGDAISPPVLGAIVGPEKRWNLAFVVVTVVMALAGVLWLFGTKHLAGDTAAAEAAAAAEAVVAGDKMATEV